MKSHLIFLYDTHTLDQTSTLGPHRILSYQHFYLQFRFMQSVHHTIDINIIHDILSQSLLSWLLIWFHSVWTVMSKTAYPHYLFSIKTPTTWNLLSGSLCDLWSISNKENNYRLASEFNRQMDGESCTDSHKKYTPVAITQGLQQGTTE
jgi:hypothetical protein